MSDEMSKRFTLALAGNPNVGKSTLFNALTGLNQHTGNWPGKTVENAVGNFKYAGSIYTLVDLPGIYSLVADSGEEKIASDYIMFEKPDAIICILDATCIERNLNLVLQILEITTNVIVCVNLLDEAEKKGVSLDFDELSLQLGVPVIGVVARSGKGLDELKQKISELSKQEIKTYYIKTEYNEYLDKVLKEVKNRFNSLSNFMILKSVESEESCRKIAELYLPEKSREEYISLIDKEKIFLKDYIDLSTMYEYITEATVKKSEKISKFTVKYSRENYNSRDRKIDKFLTSPLTGIPIMLLLMALVFWITISGANYPSELLFKMFEAIKIQFESFLVNINSPKWLTGIIIDGVYSTVTWVISVMLPPMAIFFPLFTILEDFGYLPRVAFNLDTVFKKCGAHGKQSLTTMMGFGCNACGVTGCRIINSPKERIIAILTNNFVPCNGRFPTLITILTVFFVGLSSNWYSSVYSALILLLIVVFGIGMSLAVSKILSKLFFKDMRSDFVLELPPYRVPQIGKVIVRSIFDRTLFVLGRAVSVAAPAGLFIWLCANVKICDCSVLKYITDFFEPFGKLMGLDGTILTGFILGFPANEIVLPIILMSYLSTGTMIEISDLGRLKEVLTLNGWTTVTAICMIVFSILHFPCSTTVLTVYKETKSLKWTLLSVIIPTLCGIICCILINYVSKLFIV